ncbi:ead/Ea22-like family protein [Escherichia coli]|nr:ead/Ea22-like family protein [Escherichia coli]
MSIQRISGAHVVYACSGEGDDGYFKIGRTFADEHYEKSRVTVVDDSDPDVIALLEELDKRRHYIGRLDQENEDIALTVGKLRVELEAAEKRISELEAREVVLPSTQDVHPLGPQSAKIFCEFHRNIINRCADEIRKAGVNVSIKGE